MPGPAPKDPSTRARRNKNATAAKLKADPKVKAPVLPASVDWNPLTLEWWADIWVSPMAPEYDESDRHGLFMLAMVVNDFWLAESATSRKEAAAEIRLQAQRFGLSPMDRRRLQWEIERTEEAQDAGKRRRAKVPSSSADPSVDPRSILRAV